jgi:uncharacterized membrane protein
MKLSAEWRRILRKAWSIRFILLAGVLTGAEMVLQFTGVDWMPIPQGARMLVIFLLMGGAFVARLLAQKGLDD